ncbi:methyltransferase regulatory domain-containing protein [Pelagibaculum spongiae]|uniref:Methyltransferase n=1 Tax=Pelagibaculum spongiae TaxID=2080658 RepID=A0A2V1GX61_9GAMM|nr:class I SAM-dependent methyltransferase [Pelagibaculum spongiae]PVZ68844.1 hypothetical protein DC094_11350 [Pelagibaculum spongiae]
MNQEVASDQDVIDRNDNSYDRMPYESFPYKQSSMEHLATMGQLFGMNPPALDTARVLELGSAEGGNIIPFAEQYPKAKFVGVDLSEIQIASGKKHIENLKLDNIELHHMSITDIDKEFGEFDYIICHGVLSWVPDFVADKILEVCNENLSENGIAYISYNTLPGWNMIRTIRDMMLYHVKNIKTPEDKLVQARAMINFVKDSLKDSNTPHSVVLAQEADLLARHSDHYLVHEHLEDNNKQYYFNEFMEIASNNKLQYLADSSLSTMYVGNMSEAVAQKLDGVNDLVRSEQYMDFINNRRFRSSLLCHSSVQLSRHLTNDLIKKFAMTFNLVPEKPISEINIESDGVLKFFIGSDDQERFVETSSPEFKAILYVFYDNVGFPQSFDSIVKKANEIFKDDRKEKIESDLVENGINLAVKGLMNISLVERNRRKDIDKPKLSKLARYQAKDTESLWATNLNHEAIAIEVFEKYCMGYMDGENTKEQIVENLVERAINKELHFSKADVALEKEEEICIEVTRQLDLFIEKLDKNVLLV